MKIERFHHGVSAAIRGFCLLAILLMGILSVGTAKAAPANDDFAHAIDLGSVLTASCGWSNNVGGTLEPGEINPVDPASNYAVGGASVWWKWTAPVSGRFFVRGATYFVDLPQMPVINPVIVVSTGASVSSQTQLGLGIGFGSNVAFSAVAGTTYYIAVHGFYGDQGAFMLEFGQSPANDDFVNAIDLGNAPEVSGSGTNVGASLESGESRSFAYSNRGSSSVWWKWTAPANGKYAFGFNYQWTDGELWNPGAVISSGATRTTQTQVAIADPAIGSGGTVITATAGTTYYIAAYSMYGNQGTLQFSVGPTPVNDDVVNAITLSGDRVMTAAGNTTYATSELGEYEGTLWWKWTAPANAWVTVDAAGSLVDTSLYVKQATTTPVAVASMTSIGESYGCVDPDWFNVAEVGFAATAGQVYYFCLGTKGGEDRGEVHLRVATPPANDDVANAQDLGSNGDQTISGDNIGASSEPGEGGAVNGDNQRSVWWKYTEQVGGKLQSIDTLGSDFDTVLEIYNRSTDGAMTLLRRCDDAADDGHSGVAFPVTSGSSYYIRAFGKKGTVGNLKLNLKSRAPASTVADHIAWARGFLQTLDGDGGAAAADTHLAAALATEPTNGEANVLRAFVQLTLLQQQPDFVQLLSDAGGSKSAGGLLRSKISFTMDSMGVPVTKAGSSTAQLVQYLQNHLSSFDGIDAYLNQVSGNHFLISLSDSETGARYVKIDAGDVQMLRALLRAIKAATYFLQTYDVAVSLDTVAHQSKYRQFNPEALKSSYAKLLTFAGSDRRNDFRDALKEANSRYQLGSGYAQAVRLPVDDLHYVFPVNERSANFSGNLANLAAALDGSVLWNGTRTDLSKFVSSGSSLRDFLMNFHGPKVIANTAPDPVFGGVLPESSQWAVNQYFQKHGLLYDLSTYAQWAAELLPGVAPEDQTEDANPAHDGISNRMKYVFGLDPRQHCERGEYMVEDLVKNAGDNQKYLTVSYVRRIDDASLNYVLAVSDDLKTWDRTQTQIEQVGSAVPNADGITETVAFRVKTSTSLTTRKFLRIEVSQMPR